jgi:hypothetical protein
MNSLRTFFLTFAILTFAFPAFSQNPSGRFVSGSYGISIDLPGAPTKAFENNFALLDYAIYGETAVWDEGAERIVTLNVYRPYKPANFSVRDADKAALLAEYKKFFLAELQEQKLMTSESPLLFQGMKGIEIRGTGSTRLLRGSFSPVTA